VAGAPVVAVLSPAVVVGSSDPLSPPQAARIMTRATTTATLFSLFIALLLLLRPRFVNSRLAFVALYRDRQDLFVGLSR
jgi:hypothetical protein